MENLGFLVAIVTLVWLANNRHALKALNDRVDRLTSEVKALRASGPPKKEPEPAPAPRPQPQLETPPFVAPPPRPAPQPPPAQQPPPPRQPVPPIPPKPAFDWEALVGVKLFSWIAGVALVFAAVFFLK